MRFWMIRFAMCALMPATERLPGVADTGVDAWIRAFHRESTAPIWLGVLLGSLLFMILPVLTLGIPLPACWLGRGLLDKHVRRVTSSPIYLIRQPIFIVRMAAGLCWGADPKVRAALHLPPYPADPGTWRTS